MPTLEALAQQARREHGWTNVVACLDARMREVYVAMYAADDEGWRVVLPPEVVSPSAVRLPAPAAGVCGAGGGFAAYPALAGELSLREVDALARPTARAIGELALPRFARGEGVAAAEALPFYVRHRVALTTVERDAGLRL